MSRNETSLGRSLAYMMLAVLALAGWLPGCVYHGAVFSEYTQLSMGVRADRQTNIPLRLNVGYDHGIVAIVPKHEIDTDDGMGRGQVGSLIARNEVAAYPPALSEEAIGDKVFLKAYNDREKALYKLKSLTDQIPDGTQGKLQLKALLDEEKQADATHRRKLAYGQKILRAESYVASGAAAIAATMPDNASLIIKESDDSNYVIRTHGSAGERAARAMGISGSPFTEAQKSLLSIHSKIDALDESNQQRLFSAVAEALGTKYKQLYDLRILEKDPASGAFRKVSREYLGDEFTKGTGPKTKHLSELLRIRYRALTNETHNGR